MYKPDAYSAAQNIYRLKVLLFCVVVLLGNKLSAQLTQDFSVPPAGANKYVDPISPLTQHILPNTMLPQTQPNAATMGTTPGYQVAFTPTREDGSGLSDGELFGVVDFTVPNSGDNDMGSLTIDFVTNPPPSGNNKVYVLEDPDGLATLRFNPVVVEANTTFSMSYIVANTSYENSEGADDRIEIYLENLADGQRTMLLSAVNADILNDETWRELMADLSSLAGATVQLVVEFDSNSASEEIAIDNIVFSSGSLQADWPACAEPSVPTLTQSPVAVCPLVPFRLNIDGNLGNATEWVIYADAEATQEVGRTSSASFDVFAGAFDGAAYFVRGEGGCTGNTVFAGLVLNVDDSDCSPEATPGTSFEEPLGSSEDYFDTGDPLEAHDLINNPGQPTVNYRSVARELGFTTQFIPTRSSTSGEAGLTDGDAVGVSNDEDFAFPDGDQGLVLEDTDGTTVVFMSLIDLTGLTGVTVSFDYFVNSTSYEESATGTDSFAAGITRGFTPLEEIIVAEGDGNIGLPGLATGVWTTLTYEITGNYTEPVQLIFQTDFDAGTERILIDNVSFSAGTIVCEDIDAPIVACPPPVMVDAGEDCTAVPNFMATATDDCSEAVTITYSQDSGTEFTVGVTPVMVTATDDSGKSSTCTFNVTVTDVTPPTLTCMDISVQVDSATNCTFVVPDDGLDPLAADNCGTVTLRSSSGLSSLAGDTLFVETTEISWTATDEAGLSSTCTQMVEIIVPPGCFPTNVSGQDASDFSAVRVIPNPFREGTTLSFELPFSTRVDVAILDVSGRTLATDVAVPTGNNTYSWYWDTQRQALPAGVYFARLQAAGSVYTQRLVLLK